MKISAMRNIRLSMKAVIITLLLLTSNISFSENRILINVTAIECNGEDFLHAETIFSGSVKTDKVYRVFGKADDVLAEFKVGKIRNVVNRIAENQEGFQVVSKELSNVNPGRVKAWKKLDDALPDHLKHFRKDIRHLEFFENIDAQNSLQWIKDNKIHLFDDFPDLTPGEITALSHYTTTEGYQLNFWLRGEPVLPGVTWSDAHAIRMRDFMDDAMDKLPQASPPSLSHYFRGVGAEESNILKNLGNNETYSPPNYWSASYDESVSVGFTQNNGGDVLVAIEPANTTAINITPFSQADFEGELLYKRNSTFIKKNEIPNLEYPNITDVILKQ